jgi:hypothetical protein
MRICYQRKVISQWQFYTNAFDEATVKKACRRNSRLLWIWCGKSAYLFITLFTFTNSFNPNPPCSRP